MVRPLLLMVLSIGVLAWGRLLVSINRQKPNPYDFEADLRRTFLQIRPKYSSVSTPDDPAYINAGFVVLLGVVLFVVSIVQLVQG